MERRAPEVREPRDPGPRRPIEEPHGTHQHIEDEAPPVAAAQFPARAGFIPAGLGDLGVEPYSRADPESRHAVLQVGLQLGLSTDHLNYVAGLYYFKEEADVFNPITFFGVFYPPGFALPNAYGLESESKAVFGQLDWSPASMEQLTVTLGARYTEETKEQYISHPLVLGANGAPDPALAFAGEADDDWQNFAPSLTLAWAFTDSINGYARFAKGWKSGGFNGESGTLASFQRSYDPEEVDSYELGIKTRWLDDTVQLNAAVFRNKVDEMQLSIFLADGSAASVVDNAGKATVEGFELEFLAEPVENLQINVNYGYLDAAYDEYIDGGVNVADDRAVPYAPDNTASAGIQYTIPGVMGGNLIGRLDWTYTDDRVLYTEPAQNLHSQLDSYSLLNGRITLADIEMGDGTLKVAAWGKNLLDEDYRMSTIPFIIWTVSYYGAPRTYGMEVQYQF
jgi:iron complex outermembrane receptor protein